MESRGTWPCTFVVRGNMCVCVCVCAFIPGITTPPFLSATMHKEERNTSPSKYATCVRDSSITVARAIRWVARVSERGGGYDRGKPRPDKPNPCVSATQTLRTTALSSCNDFLIRDQPLGERRRPSQGLQRGSPSIQVRALFRHAGLRHGDHKGEDPAGPPQVQSKDPFFFASRGMLGKMRRVLD